MNKKLDRKQNEIEQFIHTEVLIDILCNKSPKNFKNYIFDLVDDVEKIYSLCTGGEGNYVLSAFKDDIKANDLIKVVLKHIYKNIEFVESFDLKIYRYDNNGKVIYKKKYKPL